MQDIEEKAIENYRQNMDFLKKNSPEAYQKIKLLEMKMENGTYAQKYELEYLDEYFDVKEISSGNYLYAKNTKDVSIALANTVNFKKNSLVFEGFPMYYGYEKGVKQYTDKVKSLEDVYPIMTYYLDHTKPTDEMSKIEKFIFIGIGLGEHILMIDQKIMAEEYFLIENDVELFRLSLFVTPYYLMGNARLIFSIDDSDGDFDTRFRKFLSDSFFRNKYLKYIYFQAHSNKPIELIKNAIASQNFVIFPYNSMLEKFIRPLEYMADGYKFLNLASHFGFKSLTSKPLLVIAAGPSLDKNIKWLKQHHKSFVILAVSATLKALKEYGIKPDIVTHIDGFGASKKHVDGFDKEDEFLKNTIAVLGSFTPKVVAEKFNKNNVYIVEDAGTYYHKDFEAPSGACIGSTSIMWSVVMGFKDIYLLGIDFALSDEGVSHVSSYATVNRKYNIQDGDITSNISLRDNVFSLKGNLKKSVKSTPLLYASIQSLYNMLPVLLLENQTIYNLSDGAYVDKTLPLKSEDVKLVSSIDKTSLTKEIHVLFKDYTCDAMDDEDITSLKNRQKFALEIKEVVSLYKKNPLALQKDSYLYNFISVILHILQKPDREKINLVDIYEAYFSYVMPIVFDFLQTKGLKNTKKHIKKLDEMVVFGIIKILKTYTNAIDNFFEKMS